MTQVAAPNTAQHLLLPEPLVTSQLAANTASANILTTAINRATVKAGARGTAALDGMSRLGGGLYAPVEGGNSYMLLPLWKKVVCVTLPSLVFLVALDVAFITFIGGPAYKDALGVMMRPTPLVTPAVGAWAVIVLGVQTNTLPSSTKLLALQKGAIMGFFLYATYELSNLAVLRRWTYSLAAMDIAWGTFMCGLTGLVQHLLASALAKAEGLDD